MTMRHSRFEPATVRVDPGERVRFVLRNTDPIDHEFILGDDGVQRRHEEGRERQHHGDVPGERSVPAGQEAATTYAFPAAPTAALLEFACHLPGHYAYGMHGAGPGRLAAADLEAAGAVDGQERRPARSSRSSPPTRSRRQPWRVRTGGSGWPRRTAATTWARSLRAATSS